MTFQRVDVSTYDLVEIIGGYTELKREGQYYRSVDHDSMVIDVKHNRLYWNSKGVQWGTILDFYMHYFGIPFESALRIARGTNATMFEPVEKAVEKVEYSKLSISLSDKHHADLDQDAIDWWLSRGVTRKSIDYLSLGLCRRKGRRWGTIPVKDRTGTYLANYKIRLMGESDTLPRYMQYISNLEPACYVPFKYESGKIVMVGGEIKSIVLGQYGIPCFSSSSGVSTWSDTWEPVVSGKDVVLCFDPKEHGKGKPSELVLNQVRKFAFSVEESPLPYDPDDAIVKHGMTPGEVAERLGVTLCQTE